MQPRRSRRARHRGCRPPRSASVKRVDRGIAFEAALAAAGAGAAVAAHRDMPDLAGIAEGAAIGLAVDDDAQAEPGAEIDQAEMPEIASEPVQMLADGRRRGVVLDRDGRAERVASGGCPHHGRAQPGQGRGADRRACRRSRRGRASPRRSRAAGCGRSDRARGRARAPAASQRLHGRPASVSTSGTMRCARTMAGEIDQHRGDVVGRDLHAGGHAAIGIDRELHRRLAARAVRRRPCSIRKPSSTSSATMLETAWAVSRVSARDVGAAEAAMLAHRLQHDAAVVAARCARDWCRWRRCERWRGRR